MSQLSDEQRLALGQSKWPQASPPSSPPTVGRDEAVRASKQDATFRLAASTPVGTCSVCGLTIRADQPRWGQSWHLDCLPQDLVRLAIRPVASSPEGRRDG
jgi:hypothetical protein